MESVGWLVVLVMVRTAVRRAGGKILANRAVLTQMTMVTRKTGLQAVRSAMIGTDPARGKRSRCGPGDPAVSGPPWLSESA